MTTVFRSPTTCLQFFNNAGQPNVGGTLLTQVGGVNTATFQDAAGTIPLPNPIPLNSRGEVSNASGASCELFLIEGTTYTFTLFDANGNQIGVYPNINGINDLSLYTVNATSIPYTPPGASSVTTTVADELGYIQPRNVFDAYSLAQIANVQSNTGTFDVTAALAAANSWGAALYIPAGLHYVAGSPTFTVPVEFEYGATFNVANGQTVTFNQKLTGPVSQIFSLGSGSTVVINPQYTAVGYPEWWGALTNNAVFDCSVPINACIVACRITQLQSNDYYVANTVNLQTPNRTLKGYGWRYTALGTASRLINTSGSTTTLQVGLSTYPAGGINLFLIEPRVENLQVSRAVVPVNASGCIGINITYVLHCFIRLVQSVESEVGFHYLATVNMHTSECNSFRSVLGSGGGTGTWTGFYIDGVNDTGNIHGNASGGNASIYFNECNGSTITTISSAITSYGFLANGNFADTYFVSCEADECTYGLALEGNSLTTQNYGNVDIQVIDMICDGFYTAGIYVANTSKYGTIQITGGECSPIGSSGTAVAGIYFNASNAQVNVRGVQIAANTNATCTGITAVNSSNIESSNEIVDAQGTSIALSAVTNSRFLDHVTSYAASGGAVLQCSGACSSIYAAIQAAGKATTAFSVGYQLLSTTTVRSEFNCTGLDSSAFATSSSKLQYNATQITSAGVFGTTNLASGIMN